ncbi:hypothetical protein LCGC14_2459460 [marine sediment metagenome]|uniref:Uncharacterized protein n=1 Tax=marine sediment metagenome TaxID=412755 RepID=A0A0F9DQV9_9ZZZZ
MTKLIYREVTITEHDKAILHLSNGQVVEVWFRDIFVDALSKFSPDHHSIKETMDLNILSDMSDETRQVLINYLHDMHGLLLSFVTSDEVTQYIMDLEQLLQGLGAEGYEFS